MQRVHFLDLILAQVLALVLAGCEHGRDWAAYPAILEVEPSAGAPTIALSDVHGGYERVVALLSRHGLISAPPATPAAVRWNGGAATLLVLGDLFDKGPDGPAVLELFMALQDSARAAGGRVIVTLGNHEAEFLVDPGNDKASASDGISAQLRQGGRSPEAVARGTEPQGRWLRQLPFAARVGRWFFAHAGDTHGRGVAELSQALRAAVDRNDYDDPEVLGATSLLESEDWSVNDKTIGDRYAAALGAAHLVFGHNPSALGPKGSIGEAQDGTLFRIDCGMSPAIDYSPGALFSVTLEGGVERALSLEPDGRVRELWRAP